MTDDLSDDDGMLLSSGCIDDKLPFKLTAKFGRLKNGMDGVLWVSIHVCIGELLHVVVPPAKDVSLLSDGE